MRSHPSDAKTPPSSTKVCIVRPGKSTYSETFIRAHIQEFPGEITTLYGEGFPTFTEDDRPLLPPFQRWANNVAGRAVGIDPGRIHSTVLRHYPEYFRSALVKRFLRRQRVQAVLAEFGPTGVAMMEACRSAGVPLIVHFHGYDAYSRPTLERVGRQYPELFQMAAAIIAVSRDMERQLLSLGAPQQKLFYNPYGVDESVFQPANPASAPPVFVAVGRFVDKKAPHLTLLAFHRVLQTCGEARLIMMGDGPLWEACKQMSQALGIADAIDFRGACTHSEVAEAMRQARAFVQHSVQPSHGDSEGTPVAILEAGAAGLPVVATRHAGIPDVVLHEHTGFLVEERDVNAMAEYMLRLARDPALAGSLGAAARERVRAEFSMRRSISNLWDIIQSTVASPENSSGLSWSTRSS
jgi:colanic acid/amylovoran biosynthesis glycosyltransferase